MKYFTLKEFDCPSLPGSGVNMDKDFLEMLDLAREAAGVPFRITSGYRTYKHNEKVGGVKGSAHTKGLAADISTNNSNRRFKILRSLLKVGFTRIGINKTFIHVDIDNSLPQEVMWIY